MKRKHIYIAIGAIAFLTKLFIEFQTSLIPGINGGYYPIQIRSIIESGTMAISDVPIVFYFNAFIVKLLSFFVSNGEINSLIINVVKIVGATAIPIILIPLYYITKKITDKKISKFYEYSLIAFIVLSFSPLEFCSEVMKNAFGLFFLTCFIYNYLQYIQEQNRKTLFFTLLSLIIIAITHFGVFSISILLFVIGLIVIHNKKAIIPIFITVISGFVVISIFDFNRAISLFTIWKQAFALPYRLAFYPQGIINLLFSIFIVSLIIGVLRKNKDIIKDNHKKFLKIFLYFIIFMAFPLYNFELGRRFGLMLFVPQTIVLLLMFPYLKPKLRIIIPIIVLLITGSSLIYNYSYPKQTIITQEAYNDLKNISNLISNPDKTIIVTRHGIDWWTVWSLRTKMAHPHIKIDDEMLAKYDDILILTQKKGRNKLYPGKNSPFTDPIVPENSTLFYSSDFYDVYKFNN